MRTPSSCSTSPRGRPIWSWKLARPNSSAMTAVGLLHLLGDLAHGLVEPQPGLDADDHQVQGVGQAEEDGLLAASADEPDDEVGQVEQTAGRRRRRSAGFAGQTPMTARSMAAAQEEPDKQAGELQAQEDAAGRFAAEAGVGELDFELARRSTSLLGAAAWPGRGWPFPAPGSWCRAFASAARIPCARPRGVLRARRAVPGSGVCRRPPSPAPTRPARRTAPKMAKGTRSSEAERSRRRRSRLASHLDVDDFADHQRPEHLHDDRRRRASSCPSDR